MERNSKIAGARALVISTAKDETITELNLLRNNNSKVENMRRIKQIEYMIILIISLLVWVTFMF